MKKLTLTINGIEAVCNFGVNYFYKHYFELTKVDLLVSGLEGIATIKIFEIMPSVYCAGYLAECSLKKEDPKLTFNDFENYVLEGDPDVANKMLSDYMDLMLPGWRENINAGEQQAQTTSP